MKVEQRPNSRAQRAVSQMAPGDVFSFDPELNPSSLYLRTQKQDGPSAIAAVNLCSGALLYAQSLGSLDQQAYTVDAKLVYSAGEQNPVGVQTWKEKVAALRLSNDGREPSLDELLLLAKDHQMTAEEVEAQRQSWARQDMD